MESSSVPQLTASAKDWLKDIELIRAKTAPAMQGALSGRIRERIDALHRVLDTLAIRMEEKEDLIYQKRRNAELQAELLASQRETNRLNRRVNELQKTVDELRKHFVTDGKIPQASKATSPMETVPRDRSKSLSRNQNSQEPLRAASTSEEVMRPPLKGISTPIPSPVISTQQQQEDIIAQQIAALIERRKQRERFSCTQFK